MSNKFILYPALLSIFAGNTNKTTDSELSTEMKTFYSDYLIDMAEPELVHDQFAQKHPIPKNGGKIIEFRKWKPLATLTSPLSEGVTPSGQKLEAGSLNATVQQYGGYVEMSDMLIMTAIDKVQVQALRLLGGQAGRTLDTITREVINGGTNVQYAEGQVSSRIELTDKMLLTVNAVRKAVRFLKLMHAPTINGRYVAIIHPDCAYDLMDDPKWRNPKEYSDPNDIYYGEIGMIENCRFVETSEAKVFSKAGAASRNVYSTLIMGADAYGTTEITGGGLQYIAKQLGSAGTADPLNQRATTGWKATKVSEILVDEYLVRIETCSSFDTIPTAEWP